MPGILQSFPRPRLRLNRYRSPAVDVSTILARILVSAHVLAPVDIKHCLLFRMGAISGLLVVPPLGSTAWEQDGCSSIRAHAHNSIGCSQRSSILLRCVVAGLKSSFWYSKGLAGKYGIASPLRASSGVAGCSLWFDSLVPKMPVF